MTNYLFESNSEYREDYYAYMVPANSVEEAIAKLINYMIENEGVDRDSAMEEINMNLSITPHIETAIIRF